MNIDQIAMHYISMDLSRQALQIYGKFISNFNFVFELLTENRKYSNRVNIDQSAMYYMDLTRQTLQTNVNFFQISESFFELIKKKNNTDVGFMQARRGRHLWHAF